MYPDAVIFDFDGVIVDTEPLHYKGFQIVLKPENLFFSWNEYENIYMGFDDRDAFREVYRRSSRKLTEEKLALLMSNKASVFQKIVELGVNPYPGVIKLISTLHQQGTPLAICSGAVRSDIIPIIKYLGIADCFSKIVTAEDVLRSKPDPESYNIAAQFLRTTFPLSPDDSKMLIIAVEDTPAGISSAVDAGLKVIAVKNSYSNDRLNQADRIVCSLEELYTGSWL